ncbi:hypothetical protein AOCH_001871 [Aspergillus ochraceoroseus]|uniref:Histone H4 n=1 Tax=Aspergillus ochraceoroseus TaxID=138278 RepID=A0A0F8UP24_9EURO|nr:hypothetical protein AOCH_001871 [Aspergillus ochraceoroseus]
MARLPSAYFTPVNSGRRFRKLRDNIEGVTRRGGVVRIKKEIYAEIRAVLRDRLKEILKHVVLVLESSQTPLRDRKN